MSELNNLPAEVATPKYNRGEVTAGIAHFGVGGFHRSHEALVIDKLLHSPDHESWGLVGIGVRPADRPMKESLEPQNYLYSLTEKDTSGTNTRVIGSIIDYLYAPDSPSGVLKLLTDSKIKIVSLTITEGGYNFNQVTREFDWSNPDVLEDVENAENPRTVFGFIVRALASRKANGITPFTVMSCDNIQANGNLAKKMIVSFAKKVDTELATWIEENVHFPNSMVDRITPATTDKDREYALATLGVIDYWPVAAEPFFQWVLEDSFSAGRPNFEDADVQIVEDVEPYELMKLRLLNASHQALAYFGYLMGYRLVHEAVGDPLIQTLLRRYMKQEARPTLKEVPGVDLDAYCEKLIERFLNEEVADTVPRLCAESSDRIPKWLVAVINENLNSGVVPTLSIAVLASWARYAEGTDENGESIDVVDNLAAQLVPLAQSQRDNPLAFVENKKLFGDLAENSEFSEKYQEVLHSLWEKGARVTLQNLLS